MTSEGPRQNGTYFRWVILGEDGGIDLGAGERRTQAANQRVPLEPQFPFEITPVQEPRGFQFRSQIPAGPIRHSSVSDLPQRIAQQHFEPQQLVGRKRRLPAVNGIEVLADSFGSERSVGSGNGAIGNLENAPVVEFVIDESTDLVEGWLWGCDQILKANFEVIGPKQGPIAAPAAPSIPSTRRLLSGFAAPPMGKGGHSAVSRATWPRLARRGRCG